MKNRYVITLALIGILFQILFTIPYTSGNLKTKSASTSFTITTEHDELLPNTFKIPKRSFERINDYKLIGNNESDDFGKGNSLFYIHNQLLPKKLTLSKIHTLFFTSYFSTSV